MTMPASKSQWEQWRDQLLCWHYGNWVLYLPVVERHADIKSMDLLAVPAPINNSLWVSGDCLIWRGPLTADGYATGQRHRCALENAVGGLRGGLWVVHLCRRPFCLQPGHLYQGTAKDNQDDRRYHDGDMSWDVFAEHRQPQAAWGSPNWWKDYCMSSYLPFQLPDTADARISTGPPKDPSRIVIFA